MDGKTVALPRFAAANLAQLPEPLRRLHEPYDCWVEIAAALHKLAEQVDQVM